MSALAARSSRGLGAMPPAEKLLGGPICEPMPNGSGSETLLEVLSVCVGADGGVDWMGPENGSLIGVVLGGTALAGRVLAGSVLVGTVLGGRLLVVGVLVGVVLAAVGAGELKGGELVAVRRRLA